MTIHDPKFHKDRQLIVGAEHVERQSRAQLVPQIAKLGIFIPDHAYPIINDIWVAKTGDENLAAQKIYKDIKKREIYQNYYGTSKPPSLNNYFLDPARLLKLSYRNEWQSPSK